MKSLTYTVREAAIYLTKQGLDINSWGLVEEVRSGKIGVFKDENNFTKIDKRNLESYLNSKFNDHESDNVPEVEPQVESVILIPPKEDLSDEIDRNSAEYILGGNYKEASETYGDEFIDTRISLFFQIVKISAFYFLLI